MASRKNPAVTQEPSAETLRREAEEIQERVRAKAYEMSRTLGGTGDDFHDWLRAEAETILRPTFELVEAKDGWKAEFAVPGLEPSDLEVRLGGGSLVVKGERRQERREKDERVVVSEYRASSLFREVSIPLEVDVERVRASLDGGVLTVTLPRRKSKAPATNSASRKTAPRKKSTSTAKRTKSTTKKKSARRS